MKILLTNDDGIDAPGLQALHRTVREAFTKEPTEIIVVAPDKCRSECSHSVTNSDHLEITPIRDTWYAVSGTPVDCVRVALAELCPDAHCVFSGINAGANLGVDLIVSGTFAAAREAAMNGVAAMAISHYRRPDVPKTWDHTPEWLKQTLHDFRRDLRERCNPGEIWNVNLPAIDPGGTGSRNGVLRSRLVPNDSSRKTRRHQDSV